MTPASLISDRIQGTVINSVSSSSAASSKLSTYTWKTWNVSSACLNKECYTPVPIPALEKFSRCCNMSKSGTKKTKLYSTGTTLIPQSKKSKNQRSYGRWYRQIRAHYIGASWHSSPAASHCEDTVQDCCFELRLCPRYWSCLPQASYPPSLGFVTSVTLFGWLRWPVRFAGKHIHRPAKFLRRGSCRLEHTSTWPPLTAQQSPTVPIKAENPSFPTSL